MTTYPSLPSPRIIANNVWDGFGQAVGNTSLIRLQGPSEITGCDIYGKAEYENPGGSIKDRTALGMIMEAEASGLLVPGEPGTIVEGTAGNTGIGLTHLANARGYKSVILIPASQTQEKKDTLRRLGAKLLEIPAVSYKNPNNYVHVAARLAKSMGEGVLYADQWDNLANRRSHERTTGPEIWAQMEGDIDCFSCAMGTGGTLVGVSKFLRSKSDTVKIALTDPCGAALHRYYTEGHLATEGDSITEGIGQGRVTGNMEGFRPDTSLEVPDREALLALYELMGKEGLFLGLSSAINVAGAVRMAKKLGPGHRLVTILCDSASRSASKLYNPLFLRSRGLPVMPWMDEKEEKVRELMVLEEQVKELMA